MAVVSVLWHSSRVTGWLSLGLLTAAMVTGTGAARRFTVRRRPRVSVTVIHRRVSLLSAVVVGAHVLSAVSYSDGAGIRWVDVVVPFVAAYRRFWLGAGTVAVDLFVAVVVSSVARGLLSVRVWRLIHRSSFALFPLAVAHGFGIDGIDTTLGWVLLIIAALGAFAVLN
jgi:hypothetical protein